MAADDDTEQALEERAAIMEFHGGLSREEADEKSGLAAFKRRELQAQRDARTTESWHGDANDVAGRYQY